MTETSKQKTVFVCMCVCVCKHLIEGVKHLFKEDGLSDGVRLYLNEGHLPVYHFSVLHLSSLPQNAAFNQKCSYKGPSGVYVSVRQVCVCVCIKCMFV